MPDLLEPPSKPSTRITSANARLMAAKSAERRRAIPFRYPPVTAPTVSPLPEPAQTAIAMQLGLVADQITRTSKVLNAQTMRTCPHCLKELPDLPQFEIEPHHRAQLLRSLDLLLDRQRKLLMIPEPGPQKPRQDRNGSRSDTIDLQPMLSDAPVAPTRPMGWEYDEPGKQDTTSGIEPN